MSKLIEYLELELQRQQLSEDDNPTSPYETLLGKMDRLWYYDLSKKEIDIINRNITDVHTDTQALIDKIKGNQIMSNIFETKEEYLALRNFWKNFHADGRHKAVSEPFYSSYSNTKEPIGFHRVSGLPRDAHIIYLAAIGKPLDKAIGNATKETLADIEFQFSVLYYMDKFSIFEGNINHKYFGKIKSRILDFIENKEKGA